MKIIVTGPPGSGKTTLCQSYVREWQRLGWRVGGLLCPAVRQGEQMIGSDALDLLSGQTVPMTRLAGNTPLKGYAVGKYVISFEGISFGKKALRKALTENCDFIVIDEVGPLEMQSNGLTESVAACISSALNLAIVVRSSLINTFLDYFGRHHFQDLIIVDKSLSTSSAHTIRVPIRENTEAKLKMLTPGLVCS